MFTLVHGRLYRRTEDVVNIRTSRVTDMLTDAAVTVKRAISDPARQSGPVSAQWSKILHRIGIRENA